MEPFELICIGCPVGCELSVTRNAEDILVSGNMCKIGERYAEEELLNPTRTVTASVRITGGSMGMLSVKTKTPIPKNKIMECMKEINKTQVSAPVKIGDVIIRAVASTNVDIVATRDVGEAHAI